MATSAVAQSRTCHQVVAKNSNPGPARYGAAPIHSDMRTPTVACQPSARMTWSMK